MDLQEKLASFVKNHTTLMVCISIGLFCTIILIIVVCVSLKDTSKERVKPNVDFSELYLSDEPYFYPDIFQYRVPKTKWTEEDFVEWFSPLSEEEKTMLESTFFEETNRILEAVP